MMAARLIGTCGVAILEAVAKDQHRVLLVMTTGAGKTYNFLDRLAALESRYRQACASS